MWSNKERHVKDKIIAPTRIEKIRHELNRVEDFVSRYDKFLENVARFGDLQQSIKKKIHPLYLIKKLLFDKTTSLLSEIILK